MVGLSNLELGRYEIPMVSEGFSISLYLYDKDTVKDIVSAACEEIPEEFITTPPFLEGRESFCLDMDSEFAIFINSDICPESERSNVLAECLFHAAAVLTGRMESEEFGARVITATYESFIHNFEEHAPSTYPTIPEEMVVDQFPLPLVSDTYKLTLNLFDNQNKDAMYEKLKPEYRDKMLSGKFHPTCNHGFTVKPNAEELAIFINCEGCNSEHQRSVLVHELFHAASDIASIFDSEEVGAKLYRTVYKKFSNNFK